MRKTPRLQRHDQNRRKAPSASFKPFFSPIPLTANPKQTKKSKKMGGRQTPLCYFSSFLLFPLKNNVSLPAPFKNKIKTINTLLPINNNSQLAYN